VTANSKAAIAERLSEARARTLELVEPLDDEQLNRVYSPILSPLAWDLGHIANFEELWLVQTIGGRPPLHGDLGQYYDAIENPRRERGELPILHDAELQAYMSEVRERTLEVLGEVELGPDLEDPLLREGFVYEMLVAHELQHQETMLQLLQMLDVPYRPAEADRERFEPDRIKDPNAVIAAFQQYAGVDAATVNRVLHTPGAKPSWFLQVTQMRQDQFTAVPPAFIQTPGILVQHTKSRAPLRDAAADPAHSLPGSGRRRACAAQEPTGCRNHDEKAKQPHRDSLAGGHGWRTV